MPHNAKRVLEKWTERTFWAREGVFAEEWCPVDTIQAREALATDV